MERLDLDPIMNFLDKDLKSGDLLYEDPLGMFRQYRKLIMFIGTVTVNSQTFWLCYEHNENGTLIFKDIKYDPENIHDVWSGWSLIRPE